MHVATTLHPLPVAEQTPQQTSDEPKEEEKTNVSVNLVNLYNQSEILSAYFLQTMLLLNEIFTPSSNA